MSIRVAVPDAELGYVLAGQLAKFGAQVTQLDGPASCEVTFEGPKQQDIPTVLSVIEHWIEDERLSCVRVEIDGRRYVLETHAN